jgi:hypothetical protein
MAKKPMRAKPGGDEPPAPSGPEELPERCDCADHHADPGRATPGLTGVRPGNLAKPRRLILSLVDPLAGRRRQRGRTVRSEIGPRPPTGAR